MSERADESVSASNVKVEPTKQGVQPSSDDRSHKEGSSFRLALASSMKKLRSLDLNRWGRAGEDVGGGVLPVELEFRKLRYAPRVRLGGRSKLEERVVLHGVTASFKAGTLNALMGPSGSGKTSLLSVVAGFVDPGHVTGRMLVNGRVRALPRRLVGFVFQEDLMLSQLTVLETIQVAAALKLPMSVSRELREEAVSSLLAQLGLEHVASTLVGDAKTRGVSGGQKKRLAVAVELVTRPSVLLMDEPTSGLDATTALSLCTMLQGLASSGYNIVCSIHQPRTNIFDLFDHLLLLSLGRMVYSGPPEGCVGFLETVTGRSIPARTNAADWLMDVVSEDEALGEGQRLLPDAYVKHEQGNGMTSASSCGSLSEMNEGEEKTGGTGCFGRGRGAHDVSRDETVVRKFATTWLRQLTVLLQRENKQRRGLALTRMTLLQVVLSSILTGLFWFQLPATDATVHERSSLLFFIIIAQSNQAVLTSINSFSVERVIMQRERAKAMYRMSPYFLAKTFGDLVNSVLMPMLYATIVYWSAGLKADAAAFFIFLITFGLCIQVAQSWGILVSVIFKNIGLALILAPMLTLMLMILGGFYISFDNMPPYILWLSFISQARYGYTAMCVNEFRGQAFTCTNDATVSYGDECPLSGETVLASLGMGGESVGMNVLYLILMQVGIRVISYFVLRMNYKMRG